MQKNNLKWVNMSNDKEVRRDASRAAHYRAGLPKEQGQVGEPIQPKPVTLITLEQILLWKEAGILDSHPTGRRIDGTEGFVVPSEDI